MKLIFFAVPEPVKQVLKNSFISTCLNIAFNVLIIVIVLVYEYFYV